MPTSGQVRGMLLEEALLFLLRKSGYKVIDKPDQNDKTISKTGSGMQVHGRALKHQIDAIADYVITPPFSYPNRLLVEAKSYKNDPVGIEVIRNALGVLRDIEQYWVPTKRSIPLKKRFHYQYAVATSGTFTSDAEKFAYAHDIYLMPLARARYFQPIISALNSFTDSVKIFNTEQPRNLYRLRLAIRQSLEQQSGQLSIQNKLDITRTSLQLANNYVEACDRVNNGFLALINRRFPVFLIPSPDVKISDIAEQSRIRVRIYWDNEGWYINSAQDNRPLFSFDVPEEMLRLYLEGNNLSARRALNLKAENLSEIQIITTLRERVEFITLRLDMEWINELRKRQEGNYGK